ncbi:hypothetical protein AE938_06075 [Bacteroides fragilis]|nr:hypothetical protein [Bacteroides fragilis]
MLTSFHRNPGSFRGRPRLSGRKTPAFREEKSCFPSSVLPVAVEKQKGQSGNKAILFLTEKKNPRNASKWFRGSDKSGMVCFRFISSFSAL